MLCRMEEGESESDNDLKPTVIRDKKRDGVLSEGFAFQKKNTGTNNFNIYPCPYLCTLDSMGCPLHVYQFKSTVLIEVGFTATIWLN